MAIEKTVTLTSLQYVMFIAMTFSGIFFTVTALGAGYWNQCVSSRNLITFAITTYFVGIPFGIFMRFLIAPLINRKK